MTCLGEGRVCLGDQGYGEIIQINYKMTFIQDIKTRQQQSNLENINSVTWKQKNIRIKNMRKGNQQSIRTREIQNNRLFK